MAAITTAAKAVLKQAGNWSLLHSSSRSKEYLTYKSWSEGIVIAPVKTFRIKNRTFTNGDKNLQRARIIGKQCLNNLKENVLSQAVRHFGNDEVAAVGVFRKSALLEMNGYDTDTVGEDMELVLRLQDGGYQRSGNQIVYDPTAVCYTRVPHSLKRLLHQRDRWQRGLMDCLIKHCNMIANPLYGLLGVVTMSYQLVVELLDPIFWVIYSVLLVDRKLFPSFSMVFAGYVPAQIGLTVFAVYIDTEKNMRSLLKWMPKLILTTIEEMFLQIPSKVVRVIGMVTFHWRRLVW